jgi:hypothetical protein
MKNISISMILWVLITTLQAQTFTRTVLPAAGLSDNPQLTWTLGEVSTEKYTAGGYTLWQGFQVPEIAVTSVINETQLIPLNLGWNLISSNLIPASSSIIEILAPIADNIIIFQDAEGHTVIPSFNIYGILNWDINKGYKVKVNTPTVLTIMGTPIIPESTHVPIIPGWQIIPYLRNSSLEVSLALSSINAITEIAKNNGVGIYLPGSVNSIGSLIPTQGYWLKASQEGSLIYPQN